MITVYRTDNGQVRRVPEAHLRIFPGFFSRTPRQKAAERKAASRRTPRPSTAPTAPAPSGDDPKE